MNIDTAMSVWLTLSAICYLLLGLRLVAFQREVGSGAMGAVFVLVAVWVAGGVIEIVAQDFEIFSIGRTGHFVGTAMAPVALYFCFREYTGLATPVRLIVLLVIIPVVSVTLAATNQFHELMWYLPATNAAGDFLTRPVAWGPWFLYVHAPFSYTLTGVALLTLLLQGSGVATAHRRGIYLLVAACFAPLLAVAAYDLGLGPSNLSFVPIALGLMLPIYTWLIFGEKIIEFTPLAYESVFQNMQDPVVVIDMQSRIIGLNHRAEKLLDMREEDALRMPLDSVLSDGASSVFEALSTGEPQKLMTDTGRFLHVQASPINPSETTRRGGQVLIFRDVSDVERAQKEVRKSETLLRTLIDHSVNGIIRLRWMHDEDRGHRVLRCIFANAAAGKFLGTGADDLIDVEAEHLVRLAASGMEEHDADSIVNQFLHAVELGKGIDAEVQQRSGSTGRWLRMICEPVGDDIAATFIDVTDGKARERHMESIAWSDPLTGVLNRRGFERDASKRLTESDDDATGALLFIDLNDFKKINDECGHGVGDQLLTIAATRLQKSLRSCDIIGRPGGDEFVALVPDVSEKIANNLARRLTVALNEPYLIGEQRLACAASIGLALYPKNANTLTGLMREADQAMYRAKARARDLPNLRGTGLLEKAM